MFNTTLNTTERPWDGWLLLIVCALVGIGIVMIYSASGITATWLTGDSAFFLKRQLIYLAGGLLFLIFGLKVDYHWYRRTAWPIFAGTILVLAAVLFVGTDVNGARRWIRLGFFNVQPAEIAKVTLVFVLAYSMTKKNDLMKTFSVGILPHIILIGCVVGLLLKQPDFGSSAIIVILTGVMLLVAGTRMIYLIGGAIVGGLGASLLIFSADYRMKRIMAFLDPWGTQSNEGYQLTRSLISIGSGGVEGRGLGQGLGKLGFVPELHTDFIGTATLEELGFLGAIAPTGLAIYSADTSPLELRSSLRSKRYSISASLRGFCRQKVSPCHLYRLVVRRSSCACLRRASCSTFPNAPKILGQFEKLAIEPKENDSLGRKNASESYANRKKANSIDP